MGKNRREATFIVSDSGGVKRRFTMLSAVSCDDLMRVGMMSYIAEVKLGREYASPFNREVRDAVVRTRVTQRS